jgi:arsenate reductase (thioredoxin)
MSVLFLCVANSARSQLAEAIARHLAPGLEFVSAGNAPTHVRPEVARVLDEVGIDAYGLRSKGVDEIPLDEITVAVTLCAEEVCPVLPKRVERLRWPLPDPSSAPRAESLEAFRATRDSLLSRIPRLLASLRA